MAWRIEWSRDRRRNVTRCGQAVLRAAGEGFGLWLLVLVSVKIIIKSVVLCKGDLGDRWRWRWRDRQRRLTWQSALWTTSSAVVSVVVTTSTPPPSPNVFTHVRIDMFSSLLSYRKDQYTPQTPTGLNSIVESRRSLWCVLGVRRVCPHPQFFWAAGERSPPPKKNGAKTCKISVDFIQPQTLIANISGRYPKWERYVI